MSIKVACPECKQVLKLADELAGKKVRCKACDYRFRVSDSDEADDEEAEKKPRSRSSKRRAKKTGMPIWVWAAVGGGAFALLAIIVVVVIIVVATRPQRPDQARGPADPAKMPGNEKQMVIPPAAAAGPHAAIMEEFAASWDNAANALAQARDEGSASGAANQLRQEATKLDQLTQRLRAAGRVSDNDAPAVRQIQQRMEPNVPRLETEMNQLRQRMPGMRLTPGTANDLDQGLRTFQTSGRNFTSAGRQLLP